MKKFKNNLTNQTRTAPTGFSWTTLFFCGIPQLVRGDFRTFLVMLAITFTGLAFGLFGWVIILGMWLFYSVEYNNMYIERLKNDGFEEVLE